MSYKIKPLQRTKAKNLGLTIKPSTNKKKKVDVFKGDKKVGSVGALGYNDYATYIQKIGKKDADVKRKNYLKRHAKEPKIKEGKKTNSYYADKILW
tara:strand:+ start:1052 stop:1339 length:288 start_codon:yes stop_codon:yes gene_type:complete